MGDVFYLRQQRARTRNGPVRHGGPPRPRAQSLNRRPPARLILSPPKQRHTRDDSDIRQPLPNRLKLQVRNPSENGPPRRSNSLSDDDDLRPACRANPDTFSKTIFRIIFLGATRMKTSEPGILELNTLVEAIRERAAVYKERGVAIPRYTLNITAKHIALLENQTSDVQYIPINRIHFVAADPRFLNIFSLVARGRGNRFICHVFECKNFEQCDFVTKTVSDAFRIAYEKWLRVGENQRRLEERRAREMDMGGLEYFQEWDDHAPRGMPLYNISSYYNSGYSRPRQYLRPRDELPALPERLILSRSNQGYDTNREPQSMRFNFDDDYGDDGAQEEVYVRQDQANGHRSQQLVYDIRPDWS